MEHATYAALGGTPERRRDVHRALFDEGLDAALVETLRGATQHG